MRHRSSRLIENSMAKAVAVFMLWLSADLATAQSDKPVTITGGPNTANNQYRWEVTNHGPSPIVELSFPHYYGTLFLPADGWSVECTGLVNVGVKNPVGTCIVKADSGISRGQTVEFAMRVQPLPTRAGEGVVSVALADGSTLQIAGVNLPQAQSTVSRHITLIGLGLVFGIGLLVRTLRNKSKMAH